VLQVTAMLGCY
jgi:hypothetical protein